jgi:hypothetical protein
MKFTHSYISCKKLLNKLVILEKHGNFERLNI